MNRHSLFTTTQYFSIIRRNVLLIYPLLYLCISTYAQEPAVIFQRTIGGTDNDFAHTSIATTDNNIVIAGQTASVNNDLTGTRKGLLDAWVIKMNSDGTIIWQTYLGGSADDYITSIKETSDNGFIVEGYTASNNGNFTDNHGGTDIFIAKLNSVGLVIWVKCFGGTNNEQSAEVLESKEGGYLFTGSAKSANGDINGAPADADMWVVKITNNGSIQWQSLIQILYTDVCRSVKQFPNNDYLVIGSIGKVLGSNQQEDIYITRFSQLGFILYQYGIGGSNQDIALSCQLTKDGGWIILGKTSSTNGNITQNKGGFDLWVTKMNPSGNIQWQKTYGGTNTEANNNVGTIQITENDDYIVTSSTRSNNGDVKPPITPWSATASRIWILKLNCVGTIQWQKLIGGDSEDNGISITQTTDKGFIAISNVSSNNGNISNNKGGQDVLFTKLAPDPFIKPTLTASGSLAICDDQMVTLDGNLGNGYTYQWQKNGSDLSGETSAAITVSASGTYKLIIKPSSCPKPIVDASATVAVTPKPSLVLPATLVFCKPPLTLAPNLIVGATYQWSTGQTTPNIEVSNAGIYQVNALLGGCNVSQSVVVTQQQPPLISITDRIEDCFSVSKPFFLDAGNDPANQYKWMPGNITTSDITITQAGTYQLTVTDANLCSTTKSITIMANCVSGIYVPSIFSPNNDNINDFFSVTTLDAIEVNLKIYNRWGELVFNTSTNNSWDGTYNNLPAPEQTYTWQLNYKNATLPTNTIQQTGTLLLVR